MWTQYCCLKYLSYNASLVTYASWSGICWINMLICEQLILVFLRWNYSSLIKVVYIYYFMSNKWSSEIGRTYYWAQQWEVLGSITPVFKKKEDCRYMWVCEWISKGENCLGMCERCQSHRETLQHPIQMTVMHMDSFVVLLAKSVAFCLWTWKEEDVKESFRGTETTCLCMVSWQNSILSYK